MQEISFFSGCFHLSYPDEIFGPDDRVSRDSEFFVLIDVTMMTVPGRKNWGLAWPSGCVCVLLH